MDRSEGKAPAGANLRRGILYGILGSAAVAAFLAARPIAAAVQGGGWHGSHGRWLHRTHGPEAMRDHVQVGVKWALRSVDASEEQQQKVAAIVTGALDQAGRLHERHRENREAFAAALTGTAVDRAGLEAARKAEIALAEEASLLLTRTLADAAEALTPEQRQALLDHVHTFRR